MKLSMMYLQIIRLQKAQKFFRTREMTYLPIRLTLRRESIIYDLVLIPITQINIDKKTVSAPMLCQHKQKYIHQRKSFSLTSQLM